MQYELNLIPPREPGPAVPAAGRRRKGVHAQGRPLRRLPAGALHGLLGSLLRQWSSHPDPRWITWIAPPCVPTPAACRRFRLPPERHRLVFPGRGGSLQGVLERALSAATSQVVLAWREPGEPLCEARLESLARRARCRLYLFEVPERAA